MLWVATKRVHRRTRFSKGSLGFIIYLQDICSTKLAHTDQKSLQLSSLHAAVQPLNSMQTEPLLHFFSWLLLILPQGYSDPFQVLSLSRQLKEDQRGLFHCKAEIFWHLVLQPKTRLLPVGLAGKHCSVQAAPGNSQWLIFSLSSPISSLRVNLCCWILGSRWCARNRDFYFVFCLRFNLF